MKPVTLQRGSAGLNTKDDPADLGDNELQAAVNITHRGNKGRPGRRVGYTYVASGAFHSVFSQIGYADCYVVKDRENDAAIYKVANDLSLTEVCDGLTKSAKVDWCNVSGDLYYTNGTQNGLIRQGLSDSWPAQEYTGFDNDRVYSAAPVGHHLAWYSTRMFVAVDNVVYWSEPFKYGLFRLSILWQFQSKVVMIQPVESGLFISDENQVWFYRFRHPAKVEQITKVAPFPALEWCWTHDKPDGLDIGLEEPGACCLFGTVEGGYLGTPYGAMIPLTKNKILYPSGLSAGAGLLYGDNFIQCMR